MVTGPKHSLRVMREAIERAGVAAKRHALHEAGHAVMQCLCGAGVRSVELTFSDWEGVPGNDQIVGSNASWYEPPRAPELIGGTCGARYPSRSTIAVMVAGEEAEKLAGYDGAMSETDERLAAEIAEREGRASNDYTRDREEVRTVLREQWYCVLAVASALLDRGYLDGDEAEELIWYHLDSETRRGLLEVA